MPRIRTLLTPLACALTLAAPAAVATAAPLDATLSRELSRAGGVSGGYVLDTTTGRVLGAVRADTPRIPASVEKLFTTSTALLRFGAEGTIDTKVLGTGVLEDDGTWRGDLYLRGAGDPTFGSIAFTQRAYGDGATTADLAAGLADVGIRRVTGRIYGDETAFDRLRGGPSSNWGFDVWIGGPLSGLAYNRGLANDRGSALQSRPATFAAQQLVVALKYRRIRVNARVGERATPSDAEELAVVSSPPMSRLAALTNVPSDNYLAETLLKATGAAYGATGSTVAGAGVVRETLSRFSISPRIADGSGLSRANAATPRQVVTLLDGMRDEPGFRESLPVAGRSGTLSARMRRSSAQDRCQAKTGTLSNVSALAGYCRTANDHVLAFTIMHNSVNPSSARSAQDRLATILARQRPAGTAATRARAQRQSSRSSVTRPARSRSGGATATR